MSDTGKRLRPLGNRVLLRKVEVSSRGGIVQPRGIEGDEGTQEYEVVVGIHIRKSYGDGGVPLPKTDPANIDLPNGARVYLAKHKGWKLERDGEDELYVADVEDVLAVEESA